MRKITAGLFVSLDGVVEAPDQWHFPYYNDEMGAAVAGGDKYVLTAGSWVSDDIHQQLWNLMCIRNRIGRPTSNIHLKNAPQFPGTEGIDTLIFSAQEHFSLSRHSPNHGRREYSVLERRHHWSWGGSCLVECAGSVRPGTRGPLRLGRSTRAGLGP
ncbi:MAG: hypothetical protein ACRDTG_07975 [Pseudonocardiaceae bacterium]